MSSFDSNSAAACDSQSILLGSELAESALEVLMSGDTASRTQLAVQYPELFLALLMDAKLAEKLITGSALENDSVSAVLPRVQTLDQAELNASELFSWFTCHEQASLALTLISHWRERGVDLPQCSELQALHALVQPERLEANSLESTGAAAAAIALALSPGAVSGRAADMLNAASACTGFALIDLESQAESALDSMARSADALGFGALTLARQPSVGEPGVTCNRSLLNVLCRDCRDREHHNAIDTLRNRLQRGQLRTTEMLDHLLAALKTCGGVRRVHLLEVDSVAGTLKSRRRLHVRGAMPLHAIDIAIGAAPALEAMLLSPQTRHVTPDAVHPDVAALAGSPLIPALHSVIGSLMVADRPQAVIVVDAEDSPINAADAQRIHDLLSLGAKLMSLLGPSENGWNQSQRVGHLREAVAGG